MTDNKLENVTEDEKLKSRVETLEKKVKNLKFGCKFATSLLLTGLLAFATYQYFNIGASYQEKILQRIKGTYRIINNHTSGNYSEIIIEKNPIKDSWQIREKDHYFRKDCPERTEDKEFWEIEHISPIEEKDGKVPLNVATNRGGNPKEEKVSVAGVGHQIFVSDLTTPRKAKFTIILPSEEGNLDGKEVVFKHPYGGAGSFTKQKQSPLSLIMKFLGLTNP